MEIKRKIDICAWTPIRTPHIEAYSCNDVCTVREVITRK